MTLSVKTFKRLFLVLLALLILVPTVLAIHFGRKSASLEARLDGNGPAPVESDVPQPVESTGVEYLDPVAEPIDYQELYPELYGAQEIDSQRVRANNTAYLTFDSSLGSNTGRILDILREYNVKATFFVSGEVDPDRAAQLKRIVEEGHTVGLGSYSGSYQEIYRSVPDYLEDFRLIYDAVYENTGVKAEIFRFPGGSINAYNSGIYRELIAEMLRRRFVFFDWNISGQDTSIITQTGEQIRDNVVERMTGKDRGIVFLQDGVGKEAVVDALPGIIETLRERGYQFQPLTSTVLPVVFSYQSAP